MADTASAVKRAVGELRDRWARMDDEQGAQLNARSFAMSLATTYACARLCAQAVWAAKRGSTQTARIAERMAQRGLVAPVAPSDTSIAMGESELDA